VEPLSELPVDERPDVARAALARLTRARRGYRARVAAERPRLSAEVGLVVGLQVAALALTAGWFATGNPGAPDDGLQQIAVLTLHERVDGVDALDGRPTMVVVTGQRCPPVTPQPRRLDGRFGLVVSPDAELARRLALPAAADGCQPGYALLDGDGIVRYRTYDPRWPRHDQEQEILLEAIERGH
jgi:hypothetical protein